MHTLMHMYAHVHRAFEATHHPGEARADSDRVEVHVRAGCGHRGDRAYLGVAAIVAVHKEHALVGALLLLVGAMQCRAVVALIKSIL